MNWQPNQADLDRLILMFQQSQSTDKNVQKQVFEQLNVLNQVPDYPLYLTVIFCQRNDLNESIRVIAGLALKNNILQSFGNLNVNARKWTQFQVLNCLSDNLTNVRNTVGSIISTILSILNPQEWPEILQHLCNCLNNENIFLVEGALGALAKICEDFNQELNIHASSYITPIITHLLRALSHSNSNIRRLALSSLNQFLVDMPPALNNNFKEYLNGLFLLSQDTTLSVRQQVCQAFVDIIELKYDLILPYIKQIIEFMIVQSSSDDNEISLIANEFWAAICEISICKEVLGEYLPRILPILIDNMKYNELDLALLSTFDDELIPDDPKNIKPQFNTKKNTNDKVNENENDYYNEIDDDDDDDDDGNANVFSEQDWNLRKCASNGLDSIANIFKSLLVPLILPILGERIQSNDWVTKESAILAFGAISDGCIEDLSPHISQLIVFLLKQFEDVQPLVRSISLWTFSKYVPWLAMQKDAQNYLQEILPPLLARLLDKNKKVQESACAAFATVEESFSDYLVPFLNEIVHTLIAAFDKYQTINSLTLCDAIATLAESAGTHLNKPEYIQLIAPRIISKLTSLTIDDYNICPLLECTASIALAFNNNFQSFAEPTLIFALRVVEQILIDETEEDGLVRPRQLVAALDLISNLIEILPTYLERIISNSNIINIISKCIKFEDKDCKQSTFALVGDLAKNFIHLISPFLNQIIPILINNLSSDFPAVKNNACWAFGVIALKIGTSIKSCISTSLPKLVAILQTKNNAINNAAITIGRLCLCAPEEIAPHYGAFIENWCKILRTLNDNEEKASAFQGLCAVIHRNPTAALDKLIFIFVAIASWNQISPELNELFKSILFFFKSNISNDQWQQFYYSNQFPESVRHLLTQRYNL
eukprot:TRINITY_DN301_c0_g1_i1.p1 TRINITY_DN301_c0_g1~~TRINITY_DN301_c0_g1_i1.p1  ORF type:complete len:908 (+),score=360.99 TRINITY_DN301_c0_g1_i1:66-2726(+)